ncbi:hypothetical protein PG984_015514 [Apiospora sp. TS-2023a]
MSFEYQSASAFFLVPLEIRRAVYASLVDIDGIHITLSPDGDGRVRLTRCLNPDLGAEHVGLERKPDGDDPNKQIWCRRLASGWGPHWECEEIALAEKAEESDSSKTTSGCSFLTTCKRFHAQDFFKLVSVTHSSSC